MVSRYAKVSMSYTNSDTSSSVMSKADLFNAYHLLFGHEKGVSIELLKQLRLPALKAMYWKKALETHPDRSKVLGRIESEMDKRFKEVTLAYENLSSILKGNRTGPTIEPIMISEIRPTCLLMRQIFLRKFFEY